MGLANQQFLNLNSDLKLLIEGRTFTYSDDFSIPKNSITDVLIQTGDDDTIITVGDAFSFGSEVAFYGYSDSTVTSYGDELLVVNNNRQSDRVSQTKLFTSPVVTDVGVRIISKIAYSPDATAHTELVPVSILNNVILNKHSSNIMRIINRDANADAKASITIKFIEVEL